MYSPSKKISESVKVGLVGCGARLRTVVSHLLEATDRVEIVALADPHLPSIQEARKYTSDTVKIYDQWQDLVNDPDIDWVMIGSWNCFHAEQVIAAFEAGKHVFCEKPLGLSADECLAMLEAQQKHQCELVIGFTLRFSPHYRTIKKIVCEGYLGEIISLEFNETLEFNHGGYIHGDWRRYTKYAGSHLLEKCCHDLDIINWIVNSRAKKVASFGGCNFFVPQNQFHQTRIGPSGDGALAFETWPAPQDSVCNQNPFTAEKDIVDNQVAIIEYENGIRATFHTNCCVGIPERRLLICGTEGTLCSDVIEGKIQVKRYGFDAKSEDFSAGVSGGHGGGDILLGKELAATMVEGVSGTTCLMDGLLSAFTAFAIDEAMSKNKVVDLEDYWKKLPF